MTQEHAIRGRLEPLDALRGIAALGVAVFSHYQHFGGDKTKYPWMDMFVPEWLYTNGWFLVDLFFLVSGMVMTARYFESLAAGKVRAKEFFYLRFSRLYPLHLATLCICAGIEWRLMARKLPTVIYQHNDLYHFVLNLFYLQDGWFEEGWSYNAPSWSVCAEVVVYILFFVYLTQRSGRHFFVCAFLTIMCGLTINKVKLNYPLFNDNMSRAMIGFFLGSFVFLAVRELDRRGHGARTGYVCLGALLALAGLAYAMGYYAFIGRAPLPHVLVVFPLLIVASLKVPWLARAMSIKPLLFLGDISYAVYMIHVPLQMAVLSYTQPRGINIPTENPLVMLYYVCALLVFGGLTYRFFEMPAQRWLRTKLVFRQPLAAAGAPTTP